MEFATSLDHWVILSKAYMKEESKSVVFRSNRHRAVLCHSAAAPLRRAPWLLHAVGSLPFYVLALPITQFHYRASHALLPSLYKPTFSSDGEHLEGKHL